jgi:mannan endo-1,4-beta-mannosidase
MTACTGVADPVIGNPGVPQLASSAPADGTIDLPEGDITIVLTYDQNIFCPKAGQEKITLEGTTITDISFKLSQVTIKATGLEKGKTYKLIVPAGVVLGPTYIEAPETSVSFTVKADPVIMARLCNPNATAQALKVYQFLVENYKQKVISGTMANVNWNVEGAEAVHSLTGKYPALNTFDYVHLPYSPSNWIDYSDISPVKNWWDAGGLVSMMWHWNVPADSDGDYTFYKANTYFDAAKATVEGTWENEIFTTDLAKVATSLKQLQEEGVAVIWRPFHEAAGGWFWWGKDAESCKKLWIAMSDYFKSEGVNNLIWVWTSESDDDNWYPGDEYVDIIGRDIYDKGTSDCTSIYRSEFARYGHKIIALSECGTVGLLSEQWGAGTRWSWFMPWYDIVDSGNKHATDNWWKDAMNQTYVITRDQVPGMR